MQTNPRILVNLLVIVVNILVNLLVILVKLTRMNPNGGHGGGLPSASSRIQYACGPWVRPWANPPKVTWQTTDLGCL